MVWHKQEAGALTVSYHSPMAHMGPPVFPACVRRSCEKGLGRVAEPHPGGQEAR